MTEEEREQALEWLEQNEDKWENWIEFEWLIPEEELATVPEYVHKYVAWLKECDDDAVSFCEMYNSMGLGD